VLSAAGAWVFGDGVGRGPLCRRRGTFRSPDPRSQSGLRRDHPSDPASRKETVRQRTWVARTVGCARHALSAANGRFHLPNGRLLRTGSTSPRKWVLAPACGRGVAPRSHAACSPPTASKRDRTSRRSRLLGRPSGRPDMARPGRVVRFRLRLPATVRPRLLSTGSITPRRDRTSAGGEGRLACKFARLRRQRAPDRPRGRALLPAMGG
jgi:hypothetical protein